MENLYAFNFQRLVKQYQFLVAREGRTEEDTLEIAIDNGIEAFIPGTSIIIRDQLKGDLFMLFANYAEFARDYPEGSHHLAHEYIMSFQKQKPKFDLDKCAEDVIEEITAEIHLAFEETYGVYPNIVVCDSSNEEKKSVHVVISNCCFLNTLEADWFTREILFNRLTAEQRPYLELCVNKPNQSFRTPYSTKEGRTKVPLGSTRRETMITLVDGCDVLPEMAVPKKLRDFEFAVNGHVNMIDLSKYVDSRTWFLRKHVNNRYDFRRIRSSYCDICHREHQQENMFICVFENKAIQYCRREAKKFKLLYELEEDFSKLDFGDKQYFVNKSLTYDNLALWIKSNIAYIENKGKPFYITRNYENSHYTYEIIKDIKATRSMLVKYKNPNYNEADATSEQYITEKLGKIINKIRVTV
jgi:hypothetical protein